MDTDTQQSTLAPTPVTEMEGVTIDVFREQIAADYRPVIMRGLVKDWPAIAQAQQSDEHICRYLTSFYHGEPVELFVGPPEIAGRFFYNDDLRSFNFSRHKASLHESLSHLLSLAERRDPTSIYIGATAIPKILPGLERANPMSLVDERVPPNIWLGNQTRVPAHFDTSDNIACVVAGQRRFTLFPPEQIGNLYIGPIDVTPAGQPMSLVNDLYRPDLERFPKYAQAMPEAMVAELEPGDALYIPSLWWHQVESLSAFNVLINYWWEYGVQGTGSPFETLIHGLMTTRHLPLAKRQAWLSYFEHYLFSEENPAEHMRPEQRGPLNDMTPELAQHIKQFLRRSLSR